MNKGVLYGVGVGPGDPELMTVKAVRIIREADVVAVPDGQTARGIAAEYLDGKEILSCPMPMLRDKALLAQKHDEAADTICALLDEGKTVAFLTLGDPTVYSTYIYVHKRVLARGYEGTPELTKELQNHVKKVTAPYKYPRIVEYVDELPKTISGKIRRVEIRKNDLEKHKADKPK